MKHLFVVHSNITYLAALGVICKENLALEDIAIISDNFLRSDPVKCHFVDIERPFSQVFNHPYQVLRPFKYTDRLIKRLTNGEPYLLYVTLFSRFQRICVSNPQCVGFHFIEEGLSNYCNTNPLHMSLLFLPEQRPLRNKSFKPFFSDILMLIKGYNAKIQTLPFLYNAYFNTENIKFYGFDPNSFQGVPSIEEIDFTKITQQFKFKKQYDLNGAHIWLGSYFIRNKIQTTAQYVEAIRQGVIEQLNKRNVDTIYIKFHPSECNASRNATLKLFADYGIKTQIISNETILEIELLGSVNTSMWGFDSSLMFYAAKMGVECYAICDFLFDYQATDAPTFWKIVNRITP